MDLKAAFDQLAYDVKNIINDRIKRFGYNTRAGKNTLEGSELQKNMVVRPTEDGIELQIADYWEFIARGWVRTGNYPGTFRKFVENIISWIRRKGIRVGNLTENQLAWAIVQKIWYSGIHYRPFLVYDDEGDLSKMIPELNGYIDKWFDLVFNQIIEEIDKYFTRK